MAITASFEVLSDGGTCEVGVLRVHPQGGAWEGREGWTWGCTMRVRNGEAELFGAMEAPPWSARLAVKKLFEARGISAAVYEIKGRMVRRAR